MIEHDALATTVDRVPNKRTSLQRDPPTPSHDGRPMTC
jgi:hypothetical protein